MKIIEAYATSLEIRPRSGHRWLRLTVYAPRGNEERRVLHRFFHALIKLGYRCWVNWTFMHAKKRDSKVEHAMYRNNRVERERPVDESAALVATSNRETKTVTQLFPSLC